MTTDSSTPTPAALCSDCPPADYPADKTRCAPCPRRATPPAAAEPLLSAARLALEDLETATSFTSKKSRDRHARTVGALRAALSTHAAPARNGGEMAASVGVAGSSLGVSPPSSGPGFPLQPQAASASIPDAPCASYKDI